MLEATKLGERMGLLVWPYVKQIMPFFQGMFRLYQSSLKPTAFTKLNIQSSWLQGAQEC